MTGTLPAAALIAAFAGAAAQAQQTFHCETPEGRTQERIVRGHSG